MDMEFEHRGARRLLLAALAGVAVLAATLMLAPASEARRCKLDCYPNTTITSAPASTTTATSTSFAFSSSKPDSTFECSLDGSPYAACSSPKSHAGLAVGAHTFAVRAKDSSGRVDPTPATHGWAIAASEPAPSPAPVSGRRGGFEAGDFSEFDGWSASAGTLSPTSERAYEGTRAAKITSDGSTNNSFQRVWYSVNWNTGSDVWYGMALYIPSLSDWCWWRPVRWDNHQTYGSSGDVGGLRIENSKLYLDQASYGGSTTQLVGPVAIPQGRWFWVEVHQRLSGTSGSALSELFLDGVKMGASTQANTLGRVINHIRFGNVTLASGCSRAASVYMDRVSISDGARGPAL